MWWSWPLIIDNHVQPHPAHVQKVLGSPPPYRAAKYMDLPIFLQIFDYEYRWNFEVLYNLVNRIYVEIIVKYRNHIQNTGKWCVLNQAAKLKALSLANTNQVMLVNPWIDNLHYVI